MMSEESEENLEERVEPAPLQVALLYKMLKAQRALLKRFEDTIPIGEFRSVSKSVSVRSTVLEPKNTPTMPWITFTIYNDGPDSVYLKVREGKLIQTDTPLNNRENLTVNMKVRKIDTVVLNCVAEETANVRIFSLR